MPLLEGRRYPISACNAASHTTGENKGSVERMQSSQWLVTIALAPRCRTPPLQVLVLKMMPVFALIAPRADEHAAQGANTGRGLHCGGLHVDQGEEVTRQLRKTTTCLSRVTFCIFDQL
jgi:hypothetical protein